MKNDIIMLVVLAGCLFGGVIGWQLENDDGLSKFGRAIAGFIIASAFLVPVAGPFMDHTPGGIEYEYPYGDEPDPCDYQRYC